MAWTYWAYAALMLGLLFLGLLRPVIRARRAGRAPLARPASVRQRLPAVALSLCISATAMWSAPLTIGGPGYLGAIDPGITMAVIGLLLITGGLTLVVAGQSQLGQAWRIGTDDEPVELVRSGIFARIRHPIYTGFGSMFVGAAIVLPSALVASVSSLGMVLLWIQARNEESVLVAQHGQRYAEYCRRTGRFLPRWG